MLQYCDYMIFMKQAAEPAHTHHWQPQYFLLLPMGAMTGLETTLNRQSTDYKSSHNQTKTSMTMIIIKQDFKS